MIAGGEDTTRAEAFASRHEAERPFGHDMHVIGAGFLDHAPDSSWRRNGQPYLRIGGQGDGAKCIRRDEPRLHAGLRQPVGQVFEGMHNPVDLRAPRVCHDQDAQGYAPAVAGPGRIYRSSSRRQAATRRAPSHVMALCVISVTAR